MNAFQKTAASEPSLARAWLDALRHWLRGRRGVVAVAALVVVAGAALNWSWLVAAGIAPVLVAVLPRALMCGLGLCMSRLMGGASCSTAGNAPTDAAPPRAPPPQILPSTGRGAEPMALDAQDPRPSGPAAVAPTSTEAVTAEAVARTPTSAEKGEIHA